jgi:hypothetical protein
MENSGFWTKPCLQQLQTLEKYWTFDLGPIFQQFSTFPTYLQLLKTLFFL